MKKQHLIFCLLLVVLSGCCRSQYKGQISFTPLQRAVNPYNGNEVLKFVDNNTDTIIYSGHGRELTSERHNARAESCEDEYDLESDVASFTSSFYLSRFCIYMNFIGLESFDNSNDPSIYFQWTKNDGQSNITTFFDGFHIDYMKDDAIQRGLFKDSLHIRTKEFYNVYVAPGRCYPEDSLHVDTLFYTELLGLVGLKLSDGNLLVKE